MDFKQGKLFFNWYFMISPSVLMSRDHSFAHFNPDLLKVHYFGCRAPPEGGGGRGISKPAIAVREGGREGRGETLVKLIRPVLCIPG